MKHIEKSQHELYRNAFLQYGNDPKALCWNNKKTQELRFQRIAEVLKYERMEAPFSIHEVGCGLGHFNRFLIDQGCRAHTYSGNDIVEDFVLICRKQYPALTFTVESIAAPFEEISSSIKEKDYYCLSGTFHTKEDNTNKAWRHFVEVSMQNMYKMARKGICVNFLTTHADFYNPRLFYADPGDILHWSVKNLSRFVSVAHDIPLFEFFVYIYKPEFLKTVFPEYADYYSLSEWSKT